MRLSWRIKASMALLVAVSAALGFVAGRAWQPVSEGDMIAHVAAIYVAESGGEVSDCVARPGRSADVWIEVVCAGDLQTWVVALDRQGRFLKDAEQQL